MKPAYDPVAVTFTVNEETRRLTRRDPSTGSCELRWCATHNEPAWTYEDGSEGCWWQLVVESTDDSHEIVAGPWELHSAGGSG